MFDIGWYEIMLIGVVALLVVGPKELPMLLRTVGRYVGIVRRQANEFRAQFEQALKDSEFDTLRKEFETAKNDAETSFREAGREAEKELRDVEKSAQLVDDPGAINDGGWLEAEPETAKAGDPAAAASAAVAAAKARVIAPPRQPGPGEPVPETQAVAHDNVQRPAAE